MRTLPVGEVIAGRYRVVETVRAGESSARLRAEEVEGGVRRSVVLTDVPGARQEDVDALQKTWRALDVPGVPPIRDVVLEGETLFVVTDAVDGVTLYRDLEGRGRPLDEAELLKLASGLCDVLDRLHRAGSVCGALGPDTVLIGERVWVVELDPVLALRAIARKRTVDARVDLYGLGRVLYFGATRVTPAEAGRRVVEPQALKAMHEMNGSVSLKTEMAVEQMLEIEPSRRPADLAQVRALLALDETAPTHPSTGTAPQQDPPAIDSPGAQGAAKGEESLAAESGESLAETASTSEGQPSTVVVPAPAADAGPAPAAPPPPAAISAPAPGEPPPPAADAGPAPADPPPPAIVPALGEPPPPAATSIPAPAEPPPPAAISIPTPAEPPPPAAISIPAPPYPAPPSPAGTSIAPIDPPPPPPPPSVVRRRGAQRRISHGPATILLLTALFLGGAWIARLLFVASDEVRVKVDPSVKPPTMRPRMHIAAPRGTPLPPTLTGGDGSVMLLIPEGEFPRGVPNPDVDNGPQISQTLPAFYIDRTEVTAAQFARFVRATGWAPRGPWRHYANPDHMDLPVTGVTAEDAEEYARWLGKRLPTEEEWEKAARGTSGRTWPWGDVLPDKRMAPLFAATSDTGGVAVPVGSCAQGASPYGVLDMAGNVWEWTSSRYVAYSGSRAKNDLLGTDMRVVRGGSWNVALDQVRTTVRMPMPTRLWAPDTGFRCVLSVGQ